MPWGWSGLVTRPGTAGTVVSGVTNATRTSPRPRFPRGSNGTHRRSGWPRKRSRALGLSRENRRQIRYRRFIPTGASHYIWPNRSEK